MCWNTKTKEPSPLEKALRPTGTRAHKKFCSRGTTRLVLLSTSTTQRGCALRHHRSYYTVLIEARKTTFRLTCCMGAIHLSYLYNPHQTTSLLKRGTQVNFLRTTAHERVPRTYHRPNSQQTFGSLSATTLILYSFNAGQTFYNCYA